MSDLGKFGMRRATSCMAYLTSVVLLSTVGGLLTLLLRPLWRAGAEGA